MRTRPLFAVLLLCSTLLWYGCQRELESSLPTPPSPPAPLPPVSYITTHITGRIVAENKIPVAGAQVSAGTKTTTTDVNGDFKLLNVTVDKNSSYVKVEKQGYFTGSRTFVTQSQATNHVEIELLPKKEIGTVEGNAGGTLIIGNNGSIALQANGIVNATTQQVYTGTVSVFAAHLNPVAPNFSQTMPGALRGLTTNNEERGLQSFGMLAVELRGTGGEKLQLAPGKPATLKFPIAAALQASAPATIPLWSFDETKGMWIEEGSAVKQGSVYTGTVSHFSFWNVDAPYALTDFKVTIKDSSNNAVPRTRVVVQMSTDTAFIAGGAFTDSLGVAGGKIPANQKLKLIVYNQQNVRVHVQDIGPFSDAADLGDIKIKTEGPGLVIFAGYANSCSVTLSSGKVTIFANGNAYTSSIASNGMFRDTLPMTLTGPVVVRAVAVDGNTGTVSDTLNLFVKDYNQVNFVLRACQDPFNQHFNYSHVSEILSTTDSSAFTATRTGSNMAIRFIYKSRIPNIIVDLDFNSEEAIGTFALNNLLIDKGNGRLFNKAGNISVQITEWDRLNKYIKGNLSGLVKDSIQQTTSVYTNSFRVRYK